MDDEYLRDRYSYVAFTMLLHQYMLKIEREEQRSFKKRGNVEVEQKAKFWVLERPTELTVTDSAASVSRLALGSVYGSGKLARF